MGRFIKSLIPFSYIQENGSKEEQQNVKSITHVNRSNCRCNHWSSSCGCHERQEEKGRTNFRSGLILIFYYSLRNEPIWTNEL